MAQNPEKIGPYSLEKLLGSGGMGEVYQAFDHRLHRRVAIKQLQNGSGSDAAGRERFLHEARSVASLSHPSIVQIHDILEDESGDWIVMEMVDGPTVAELVAQGPLAVPYAVSIGRQVAEGLVEAHDQGILHRDLKSENVMVARGDRAKILDFGLAKKLRPSDGKASLAGQGRVLGTCRAMSPEQARDQELDERSDLFALGVLLYEMLTGESPFQADNHTDTLTRVCHFKPAPITDRFPEVPADLSALVDRLLQKDREKRPQTAHEVAEFLTALDAQLSPSSGSLSGPALSVVPPPPVVAGPTWMTESIYWTPHENKLLRGWLRWGGAAIAAALVLAIALVALMELREPQDPEPSIPIRPSVAVLGLKNISEDPEFEWVGRAITEALNAELAAGDALRPVPSESLSLARQELGLTPDTLGKTTLSKLRSLVAIDYVVVGSYTLTTESSGLDVIVYVQNTLTGETLEPLSARATVEGVVILGHQLGSDVRRRLGVGPSSIAARREATATLPKTDEARRHYFDGLRKLEEHDAVGAREQLELAIEAEPDFALSYSALAKALADLGLDALARSAAEKAGKLAEGLPNQERQFVRARAHEMSWRTETAIEAYRILWENHPENFEFGLSLAGALTSAGKGDEALEVIHQLRELLSSTSKDLRLDLAEIEALRTLSRYEELVVEATRAERSGEALGARIFTASVGLHKAFALLRLGQQDKAHTTAKKAQRLYQEAGDSRGEAFALNRIGNVFYESGDCKKALPLFEEFRARMEAMGHKKGLASALNNVATCSTFQGNLSTTENLLQRSIDLAEEVGDLPQAALARVNLADLQLRYGRLDEAQRILDDVSEQAEKRNFPYAADFAQIVRGVAYLLEGEVGTAGPVLEQAHQGYSDLGDPRYISFSLHSLGALERLAGNSAKSRDYFRQALDQRVALKDDYIAAQSEVGLGWTVLERNPGEALRLSRSARSAFQRHGSPDNELESIALEVAARLALGSTGNLDTILRDGEVLSARSQNLLIRLGAGIHLARGWHALGQSPRARKNLEEIREQADELSLVPLELEAMLALAEIEEDSGRVAQAQDLRREVSRRAKAQRLGLLEQKAKSGLGPN